MFKRLILFNLLLLAALLAGILRLRRDAITFSAEHQASRVLPKSEKPLPKPADALSFPPKQEWNEIAIRNPFSFDRNDITLVTTPAEAPQPKRPKPILLGTMMIGRDRLAMLASAENSSRISRPVRIGESVDGWTLVEIQEKSAIVRWDESNETLIMDDPTAQLPRDYSKTGGTANPAPLVTMPAPANTSSSGQTLPVAPGQQPTPNGGRKQIVVQTPFGPKIMDDAAQQ
jgi:hypothetical protein